jgi:hypothetical protein
MTRPDVHKPPLVPFPHLPFPSVRPFTAALVRLVLSATTIPPRRDAATCFYDPHERVESEGEGSRANRAAHARRAFFGNGGKVRGPLVERKARRGWVSVESAVEVCRGGGWGRRRGRRVGSRGEWDEIGLLHSKRLRTRKVVLVRDAGGR